MGREKRFSFISANRAGCCERRLLIWYQVVTSSNSCFSDCSCHVVVAERRGDRLIQNWPSVVEPLSYRFQVRTFELNFLSLMSFS